jgi:2-C-methyl-D-erythritol 4-phosphate cytidylyltransferase
MGKTMPKQFLSLTGRPVFLHSLERILLSPSVDEIVIVAPPGREDHLKSLMSETPSKPVRIVPGGENRQDSARFGVEAVSPDAEIILIHDAVRPCVDIDRIEALIMAVREFGAAVLAVPVKDTLKRVEKGIIVETVDRGNLWQVQTPQGFRADWIRLAHKQACDEGWTATDDAALVERLGHPVRVVLGDQRNIKITTPEDLELAEKLMGLRT